MSVNRLRELLRELPMDERITLEEVQRLIDASTDDATVTPGERLWLEAALEAHAARFTPEAYAALEGFLKGGGR